MLENSDVLADFCVLGFTLLMLVVGSMLITNFIVVGEYLWRRYRG